MSAEFGAHYRARSSASPHSVTNWRRASCAAATPSSRSPLAFPPASPAFAQARWSVDPKPAIVIGGNTAAGEPVLSRATGATRLPSGTIVADGTAPAVRFFASDGRLINQVGRAGNGPGEYSTIAWLGRCGEDSLFVYDLFKRRLTVLDANGRFVRQFQPHGEGSLFACSSKGALGILGGADMAGFRPGSDRRVKARVTLATSLGVVTATIPDVPFYELSTAGGGTPLPNPLGTVTAFALSLDRLFLGAADSAAVDIYTHEGRLLGHAILKENSRRPTPAHQEAAIEDFLRFSNDVAIRKAMRDQLAKIPVPERLPAYSAVLTDSDGLLWVHRSVPGDARSQLTAVRADGHSIAEVELPVYLKIFEIGSDYILGARDTEDGEPQVLMYRLRRGP